MSTITEGIEGGTLEPGFPAVGDTGCTATLLSSTVAITAAHCGMTPGSIQVAGGRYAFDAAVATPFRDLLLAHLSTPVPNAPTLPVNGGALPAVGDECTIVGFGMHHNDDGTKELGVKRSAKVWVSAVDSTVGNNDPRIHVKWRTGMTNGGDSGGPLICKGKIAGVLKSGTEWPALLNDGRDHYSDMDAAWVAANMGVAPPSVTNSLYLTHGSGLYRVDKTLGNWQQISTDGRDDWGGNQAMTSMNGLLYSLQSSYLTTIDPSTGAFSVVGQPDWTGSPKLTSVNGSLYAVQGFGLWKIDDPTTGAHHRLGNTDWTGATSIIGLGGALYIIQDSRLYKVNVANGFPIQLGGAVWDGPTSMAAIGSALYIQQHDGIYKVVNFVSGNPNRVGSADWTGATSLTALNGALYLEQGGYLHRIDPSSGSYDVLNHNDWPGGVFMTALP